MNTLKSGLIAALFIGAGALTNGCATQGRWMSTDGTPFTEPRVDLNNVKYMKKIEVQRDGALIPGYEVKFGNGIHSQKVIVRQGDGSYSRVDSYFNIYGPSSKNLKNKK